MAIDKLTSPQAIPSGSSDWVAAVSLIEKAYSNYENGLRIDYSGNLVLAGSIFQVGGSIYIATSDTSITGTPSDYVKLTVSGSNLIPSYVASLSGVSWNATYRGYYDGSGNLYVFDEMKDRFDEDISTIQTRSGLYAENIINKFNNFYREIKVSYKATVYQIASGINVFYTANLNTTDYNNISGASMASNQLTLPAGNYILDAACHFGISNAAIARLYNVTDAVQIEIGNPTYATSGTSQNGTSTIHTEFNISSTKIIRLEYMMTNSGNLGVTPPLSLLSEYQYIIAKRIDFD